MKNMLNFKINFQNMLNYMLKWYWILFLKCHMLFFNFPRWEYTKAGNSTSISGWRSTLLYWQFFYLILKSLTLDTRVSIKHSQECPGSCSSVYVFSVLIFILAPLWWEFVCSSPSLHFSFFTFFQYQKYWKIR